MALLRPLPEADGGAAAFWQGAAQEQLLIQRCRACGSHQHYARPFCLKCRSTEVEMTRASGRGTIYSFTVIHRGPYEDIPLPYIVALVRLEEGPVMLSHIVGSDASRVKCDLPVSVCYQPLREGVTLPVFRLERE